MRRQHAASGPYANVSLHDAPSSFSAALLTGDVEACDAAAQLFTAAAAAAVAAANNNNNTTESSSSSKVDVVTSLSSSSSSTPSLSMPPPPSQVSDILHALCTLLTTHSNVATIVAPTLTALLAATKLSKAHCAAVYTRGALQGMLGLARSYTENTGVVMCLCNTMLALFTAATAAPPTVRRSLVAFRLGGGIARVVDLLTFYARSGGGSDAARYVVQLFVM
jgi:hypothetical protein